MNIRKIIYATDFSSCCDTAMQYATAFASAANARLLIVHVDDETPGLVIGNVGYGYLPQIDQIAQQQLEKLKSIKPESATVVYEHHFLRGNVADEIINFSQEQEADLIVIGSHGASGIGRLLLGSVAEAIIRRSTCPVLAVRANACSASPTKTDSESGVGP